MPEQEDKYEVQAMSEEQAKAWFILGSEALEKMDIKEIADLQAAMDKNPNAYTDEQRAQVKELSWKMIENVANRKRKLDPKETNSFRSMLDHVPATTFMESGKDLDTFKDAEQRWFNADRGIDDRTFGERVKDQATQAKKHVSEKAAELRSKGKAVHRLNRMKYNRSKEAIKQKFAQAKAKAAEFRKQAAAKMKQGAKTAAEVPFVLAFGVKELASMGYNAAKNKINQGINAVKNGIKRRVEKVTTKVSNGWNKTKNFGKKLWNGTKKVAKVTGYIIASPVILPYKGAKWVYNKGKAAVNWVRNGYNKLKAKAFAGPTTIAQDVKTAEKQARGNQNKLSAEQVMANWKQIGRGESDGRYNMAKHSESVLDAAMKGEIKIDKSNAAQMAAWLEVNRDIQDRINHNNVTEKNERNKAIAAQLEQFGYENPYKTKETQAQEAQDQTPPVQEPPVQDKPKEQEPPVQDKPLEAEPKPKEVKPLTEEQSKLVQTQLGILQQFGQENGLKPDDTLYKDLSGLMEKGFAEKGISPEQMEVIRQQNPNLFPPKEQDQTHKPMDNTQDNTQKPAENTQQPNTQQPNTQKPAENTAHTPDPNNPDSFNFAGITGGEAVSAAESGEENKAKEALAARRKARTPEEIEKIKQMKKARQVLMAQGRLRAKPKPVKTVELNPNTRTSVIQDFQQRA